MSSNAQTKIYWMDIMREWIFKSEISKSSFNQLFCAPLCLPARKGFVINEALYGKGKKYFGENLSHTIQNNSIQENQDALIVIFKHFDTTTSNCVDECLSFKHNLQSYTDNTIKCLLEESSLRYCSKSQNLTANSFIAYFEGCNNWDDERVTALAELYASILKSLFMGYVDKLRLVHKNLHTKCDEKFKQICGKYKEIVDYKPSFLNDKEIDDDQLYIVCAKMIIFGFLYYAEEGKKYPSYHILKLCGCDCVQNFGNTKDEKNIKIPAMLFYELCEMAMKDSAWNYEKLIAFDEVIMDNGTENIPVELSRLMAERCKAERDFLYNNGSYEHLQELADIENRYKGLIFYHSNVVKVD